MVRLPDAAGQIRNVDAVKDFEKLKDIQDVRDTQDVNDLKEMPVKVLRGLFSGIGQLLLAADRFRARETQHEGVNHDGQVGPPFGLDGERAGQQTETVDYVKSSARGRHRKPAGATTAGQSRSARKQHAADARKFRSLDATGNVRLLTPDSPAESSSRTRAPSKSRTGTPSPSRTRTSSTSRTRQKAPVAPDLPVPGYDGLSLPSLRARLRYLDANQLRTLLDYEKSASNRADVVTMFERRIAKIESGPDAT